MWTSLKYYFTCLDYSHNSTDGCHVHVHVPAQLSWCTIVVHVEGKEELAILPNAQDSG